MDTGGCDGLVEEGPGLLTMSSDEAILFAVVTAGICWAGFSLVLVCVEYVHSAERCRCLQLVQGY
jgi:hypothetical protein